MEMRKENTSHFSMKIGLICPYTFTRPGGVQEHVRALHKEFIHFGQQSKIIVPRLKDDEDYGEDVLLVGRSMSFPGNDSTVDLSISINPSEISDLLEMEKFDILHLHNVTPLIPFQFLEKSKATNIVTLHAELSGSKTLKWFPSIKKLLHFYLKKRIDGAIIIAPTLIDLVAGARGPIEVIPNGVDLKRFNPKIKGFPYYDDEKINLLFVGRIEKRKGLIYLLRSFELLQKKLKNLRLIVVGDGDLKKECEDFVNQKKLPEVVFVGAVKNEDLPIYYASADIFVSPATHGESFGIVLLEAMASGLPVVAFANTGYKAVLTGLGSQFLAEPRNVWELTQKIETLILSNEKREELKEWSLDEVQKYSWEKIAARVLNFYEQVLTTKGKNVKALLQD